MSEKGIKEEQAMEGSQPDTSLDLLFGSKTRVKLLRLFLDHPDQEFFVREVVRRVNTQINAVRRELDNLVSIGILRTREGDQANPKERRKKFFQIDMEFVLTHELKQLYTKARFLMADRLIDAIQKTQGTTYLALTGYFIGNADSRIDMLVVGNVDKGKIASFVHAFEKEYEAQIRYTVFSEQEYQQRQLVVDQFLSEFLRQPKIVVMDQIAAMKMAQ